MSDSIIKEVPRNKCSGCGVCMNICPVNAINMGEDDVGFIIPYVDDVKCVECGKCTKICPIMNYENFNDAVPELYAVRADDEIRMKSSSGGLFTVLSRKFFEKNGAVVGAVFDDNLQLQLVIAENENQIGPMRGAKYVQANTGFIYKEVQQYISDNRPVLFFGCPCQIAAIKNYIKDNNLLYTVDLICHGVSSQYILNKYFKDKFHGKKVQSINFRDKSHGWVCTYIDISFSDGSEYHSQLNKEDPYEVIFHKNIGLRENCTDCKFCDYPRVGDLSIGDFWGISKIDSSQNDEKGTSMVFINNDKGKELFFSIQNITKSQKIDTDISNIPNRIRSVYPANPSRGVFFNQVKRGVSVPEAASFANKGMHDIGLVGIYTIPNFGGALTYFALYKALCNLGYSVLMIERPNDARNKPSSKSSYNESPFPKYDLAQIYPTKEAMRDLNQFCDIFMVGSDQMFNDLLYRYFGKWCTLDWVEDNHPKLAYAASFGHDYIWSPENNRAEMSYFMKKFDAFSVREESGVKICKEEFGVDAEWVLDPVFLCDPQNYFDLSNNSTIEKKENYISAYLLDLSRDKSIILDRIAEKLSLETQVYTEMDGSEKDLNGFEIPVTFGGLIEDRLASLVRADFIVTDSFHGTCMAIILKKNFITITNYKRGKSRFESILGLLGLKNRMIDDSQDLDDKIDELLRPIDYNSVYSILNAERSRCLTWIKNALEQPKKSYSTYDMLHRLHIEMENILVDLKDVSHRVIKLGQSAGMIYAINEINEYLDSLQNTNGKMVIIAVKDTIGSKMSSYTAKKFLSLGLTVNQSKEFFKNNMWKGYIAILGNNKVLYEQLGVKDQAIYFHETFFNMQVDVASKPLHDGNSASIKLNNIEYAVNKRGLNIVVYDIDDNEIIDSVGFDTHDDNLVCYRHPMRSEKTSM